MPCSIQDILTDNPCLYQAPDFFLDVAIATSWCGINGNVSPGGLAGQWWNPDQGQGWSNPDAGNGPIVNPDA